MTPIFTQLSPAPVRYVACVWAAARACGSVSTGSAATLSSMLLRMGESTNFASSAAMMGSAPAIQSTGTQLPADAFNTLASGMSKDDVPLAVYNRPLLVAAYFGPKVSPLAAGNSEKISP